MWNCGKLEEQTRFAAGRLMNEKVELGLVWFIV